MAEGGTGDGFYKPRHTGGIRPRPNVALRKGAKFAMCNGTTCRGENCTFAHSPEEMRAWNSQLSVDFDDFPPPVPEQQSFVLDENDFPSIPSHNQHYFGPTPSTFKQFQNSSPWQPVPKFSLQQEIHTNDWPAVQYPVNAVTVDNLEAAFTGHASGGYPSGTYQSNTYISGPPSTYVSGPDAYGAIQTSGVYSSGQPSGVYSSGQPSGVYSSGQPSGVYSSGQPSGVYSSGQPSAYSSGQPSGVYSSGQPSGVYSSGQPSGVLSTRQTPHAFVPSRFPSFQASVPVVHNQSSLQHASVQQREGPSKLDEPLSGPDPLYAKLSANNYVNKFRRLVEVEKTAHEGVLRERCNGEYSFSLLGSHCPSGAKSRQPEYYYQQYAQLENISSDNLAYIRQTCTSVTLSTQPREEFKAEIIDRLNKRLIIAFKKGAKVPPRRNPVKVTFNLKDSYFNDLLRSVNRLNSSMIERIMPSSNSFNCMPVFSDVHLFESYCSNEQPEALKIMAGCSSSGPPILLTGAFGTGKSRLLALSVHYFQTLQTHRQPIRILVCTQQRISADKFLEYYDQLWVDVKKGSCFLIREYALDEVKPKYRDYCKSSKEFEKIYRSSNCDNLLLITTCLTATHLHFLPPGYFTHILIDEGSMMREPEAVAPLFLADTNTKIIIAGDANQVGPAMLVLGDLAKSNGMSVSLLQRLEKLYKLCGGNRNVATLSTNYRCHPVILELVGNLFYEGSIKWNKDEAPPATHRSFSFPLVFVCSCIDEDVSLSSVRDDNEATTIYQKVMEAAKGCPSSWAKYPTSDFFVISPSEEQVHLLRSKFKKAQIAPEIKSSISIQGREFQAIFLSTSELVHEDGSSRNPLRSLCDPYVFNTAITRAKSLVIGVGNPFLLLKMEKKMVQFYGQEHNAHCWSTFLNLCLQHNTVEFAQHLKLTIEQQANAFAKMRQMMESVNGQVRNASELQEKEDLENKVENLELELKALSMRKTFSGPPRADAGRYPDLNRPVDINLPTTPFFPFAIDPNTGSTFPPGFSYQLYKTPMAPQDNVPVMSVPRELPLVSPQQGLNKPPSSYTGSSGYPVPLHAGVMEDIEDPESASNQDSYHTEMTLRPNGDHSYSTYSDVQRVSPTTELGVGSWNQNHTEKASADSSLTEKAGTISGNGRWYTKEGRLGSGGFGVVYHVIEGVTGNNYALKVIRLHENELVDHPKRLREVEALKKLNHDHIVHYEDHWIDEESREWQGKHNRAQYRNLKPCLFILTELCESTTLKDWLAEHSGENSRNRKIMIGFFEQIIKGLVFIHQNGCTHRDLKPSNIFFGRFDQDKLKIGDFGLVLIEQPSKSTADASADMERLSTYSTQRGGGTFPYMSPEQQEPSLKAPIECKTDIYSLGIILFELHYPKKSSEDERSQVFNKVRADLFPVSFQERMPKVHEAVQKMTNRSSKLRPSASEVQKHILADLSTMNRKTRRSCVPVL